MSDDTEIRLRDLLPERLEGLEGTIEDELRKDEKTMRQTLVWGFIRESAAKKIIDALDFDVFRIVANGWAKADELARYSNQPAGETAFVHLLKHDFTKPTYPTLVVDFGLPPHARIRFTLDLIAHFEGAVLEIRDRHIVACKTANASVQAQLKYGDIKLHKRVDSKKLDLPGTHRFKEPIRIGLKPDEPQLALPMTRG
jgi:hypothetical protein